MPAIQREFVWEDKQIVRLFDSVLRGYPIGSFLSWRIDPSTADKFRFYGFIHHYHEKDSPHCRCSIWRRASLCRGPRRPTAPSALNVCAGISHRALSGGGGAQPEVLPKTKLYLNVLSEASENELGMRYDFRMLRKPVDKADSCLFVPSQTVRNRRHRGVDGRSRHPRPRQQQSRFQDARGDVESDPQLRCSVYSSRRNEDQDVEKVLDIFIRVNSSHAALSYSNLLLSIAVAQWKERDAKEAIHSLVDRSMLPAKGSSFQKTSC